MQKNRNEYILIEIIAPHPVDTSTEHFRSVEKIALKKGFIKIRCISDGESFVALEGSHRLALAKKHNLRVIVKKIKLLNRKVKWSDFDGRDCQNILKMFKSVIDTDYCHEKTYILEAENVKIN